MVRNDFTIRVVHIIKNIPKGKVLTYGIVARMAGSATAARQVSWILHSSSKKHNLPWYRVINSKGMISLKTIEAKNYQKKLLEKEGVEISNDFKVDLNKYLYRINVQDSNKLEDFLALD